MKKIIDPKQYGLPPGTIIEETSENNLVMTISRKSRVIMSDGRKIVDKINRIKKMRPDVAVSLRISAPLCSKTKKFLEDHGLEIIFR